MSDIIKALDAGIARGVRTPRMNDAILSTFRSHLIRIMSENAFDAGEDE